MELDNLSYMVAGLTTFIVVIAMYVGIYLDAHKEKETDK